MSSAIPAPRKTVRLSDADLKAKLRQRLELEESRKAGQQFQNLEEARVKKTSSTVPTNDASAAVAANIAGDADFKAKMKERLEIEESKKPGQKVQRLEEKRVKKVEEKENADHLAGARPELKDLLARSRTCPEDRPVCAQPVPMKPEFVKEAHRIFEKRADRKCLIAYLDIHWGGYNLDQLPNDRRDALVGRLVRKLSELWLVKPEGIVDCEGNPNSLTLKSGCIEGIAYLVDPQRTPQPEESERETQDVLVQTIGTELDARNMDEEIGVMTEHTNIGVLQCSDVEYGSLGLQFFQLRRGWQGKQVDLTTGGDKWLQLGYGINMIFQCHNQACHIGLHTTQFGYQPTFKVADHRHQECMACKKQLSILKLQYLALRNCLWKVASANQPMSEIEWEDTGAAVQDGVAKATRTPTDGDLLVYYGSNAVSPEHDNPVVFVCSRDHLQLPAQQKDQLVCPLTALMPTSPVSHITSAARLDARRFRGGDLLEDVSYKVKPLRDFVGKPPQNANEMSFKDHAHLACEALQQNGFKMRTFHNVYSWCAQIAQDCMDEPAARRIAADVEDRVACQMVAAIVLFTFDLCLCELPGTFHPHENFYWCFNSRLRQRDPDFLASAHGYLWLLMTGLSKLSRATGFVYRGINKDKAAAVLSIFEDGKRIHFSAPSSTTPDIDVAKQFAGVGGIILRFKLLKNNSTSADIQPLSAFSNEAETLLFPNFKCLVSGRSEAAGIAIIDLIEEMPGLVNDI